MTDTALMQVDLEALGADPAELADLALRLAVEAGELIAAASPEDLAVARTKSSATDIVTVMDQRSQDLLLERLAEHRPLDGVHGEEEGGRSSSSGLTWVVDPIDGTVNYAYGIAAYAVSVAVVVGDPTQHGAWRPVAGAVVDPVAGHRYVAALGRGAHLHQGEGRTRRLDVGEGPEQLGQALCGTGFGYDAERRRWQGRVLAELLPQVRDIRRIGSAALDLCRVADSTLDVTYERGLNPWDLAAGWLIATEAGAVVTDLDGGAPGSPMLVAGPSRVQTALRERLTVAIEAVGPE